MTGRWLTFFVNIYCKGGGWEGSTWKCKALYFSSNTACCMESKGTKQLSLPIANIRAVPSDAYIIHTGKTIQHNSVSEAISIDVFITPRDRKRLYHHLRLITVVFAKGAGMFTIRRSFVSPFCQFFFFLFLFSHLSLPSLCLSISFSPPKLSVGARSGTRNC